MKIVSSIIILFLLICAHATPVYAKFGPSSKSKMTPWETTSLYIVLGLIVFSIFMLVVVPAIYRAICRRRRKALQRKLSLFPRPKGVRFNGDEEMN